MENTLNAIALNERTLSLEGGFNFRDLGGIINKDEQVLRKGLLIRSDDLANLTDNDLEVLNDFPIRTIIDLRTIYERSKNPDHIPNSCNHEVHLDISSGHFENLVKQFREGISNPKEFMCTIYQDFVLDKTCQSQYKKFFDIVQHKNRTPILFHCTAGKDRTGFATAMILAALKVDFDTIMEDYMDSNICLEQKYAHMLKINPDYKYLIEVYPVYLETAFQTIKKEFGTIEYYLTNILGVDLQLMEDLYLKK
ncbi:protein-tyrosine phosphatase [Algoriella xinjiangensis]|uniref:Protein-tyrosine phosphatase n=1 Tax=Algoriella xinjiangensis TaxID=684065 RepID=A0A1I4ZF76_9FLAO|nr:MULTISPECIES: tyrosine-protein phosphatase [Algoriella]MBO6212523.1 tyrosine-protein phosphatase [Algoriella sp.]SFN48926.1 protein-tyrosine phosphatase [Algoriella xinjiangensis]VDH17528.1 Tyrosine-protein phosphatase precursor [Algoriella xinjiangensis]